MSLPRNIDSLFFVVPSGIAGKLEHLGAQVLEDRAHVDAGARAHARGVLALAHVPVQARRRELEARPLRHGGEFACSFALAAAALALAGHLCVTGAWVPVGCQLFRAGARRRRGGAAPKRLQSCNLLAKESVS